MHAEHNIAVPILSICLSAHLSNASIVSKRMHLWSHFLDDLIGASF